MKFITFCKLVVLQLKFTVMLTPSEMKDRMHELALKEEHIAGIYNYCDRWCERCTFTSKCLNFASSKDEPDSDGPELWDYLHTVFEATMLMLEEMMEEAGIDPDEIKNTEPPEKPDQKYHPLYKKVHELSFSMHHWLEEVKPGSPSVEQLEISSDDELTDKRFKEALEVIYFYNFFISAKIYRALIPRDDYEADDIQTDSNGSAKIALIAVDRLIAAWSLLMEKMTDHEDEILKFLISLADIRKQTELTFPVARKFVRPGFDD
jgi:hypothetical protein